MNRLQITVHHSNGVESHACLLSAVLVSMHASSLLHCNAYRLLSTLPRFVPEGSALYIASDETTPHFFDPLKSKYQVFMLDDFEQFWAPGSQWHAMYTDILGPNPEFDDTMRVSGG